MKKYLYLILAFSALSLVSCNRELDTEDDEIDVDPFAVTGVSLDIKSKHLNEGDSFFLRATVAPADATDKTVVWSSDAKGIATVDQQGKVTAVSAGVAVITVKTNAKNYKASCFVTVESAEAPEEGIIPPVLPSGKTLYNGIQLPDVWPPRNYKSSSTTPMDCPYLTTAHPAVVPIDFGRQLLFDDFLIASKDGLQRVFYQPVKFAGNPILPLTNSMEQNANHLHGAGPKDGGVWWDPRDATFKMWYEAGWLFKMAYATSEDGVTWVKPKLKSNGHNELVSLQNYQPNSCNVVIDFDTKDEYRYKMFFREPNDKAQNYNYNGIVFVSTDGIEWTKATNTGPCGDRSSMFYNPFRKKWVYSVRTSADVLSLGDGARMRYYKECDDLLAGASWNNSSKGTDLVFWCRADSKDEKDPAINIAPQLYNVDAVAYESVMLGIHEILVDNNDVAKNAGRPKVTDLKLAFSRDGFHWDRPDRRAFIASSRTLGSWDRGYVQPCGGICSVYGDKLVFWYIGFAGDPSRAGESPAMHSNMRTGVATMRRDGFASLKGSGSFTTVPIKFNYGKYLFINADCKSSQLTAELLTEDGAVIPGFEKANCIPFTGDSTIEQLKWQGGKTLQQLEGQTFRIKFYLTGGELYSFWVSQSVDGRSFGFVAGGGPGYKSNVDNMGLKAYDVARVRYPFN